LTIYTDKEIPNEEKNILNKVNNYFEKLIKEDSFNYFNNLKNVTFKKSTIGYYLFPSEIYYSNLWVLVHELFHLSSYNKDKEIDGLCDSESNGIALTEGMTEYLTMELFQEEKPTSFYLEVFTISILLNISDFKSFYFKASREDFINSFINKKNIIELSNLLDQYYYINHGNNNIDLEKVSLLVDKILNLLLDILFENIKDSTKIKICINNFILLLDKYKDKYILFNDKVFNKYTRVLERY